MIVKEVDFVFLFFGDFLWLRRSVPEFVPKMVPKKNEALPQKKMSPNLCPKNCPNIKTNKQLVPKHSFVCDRDERSRVRDYNS